MRFVNREMCQSECCCCWDGLGGHGVVRLAPELCGHEEVHRFQAFREVCCLVGTEGPFDNAMAILRGADEAGMASQINQLIEV